MTNRNCPKRTPRYIVTIVALVLAFATLPRAVFSQAATGTSAVKIGIIGSGNIDDALGTLYGEERPFGAVLFPGITNNLQNSRKVSDRWRVPARYRKLGLRRCCSPSRCPMVSTRRSGKIIRRSSMASCNRCGKRGSMRAMARSPRKRVRKGSASPRRNIWPARASSERSTRSTIGGWPASPIERKAALASPWRVMTKMPWR